MQRGEYMFFADMVASFFISLLAGMGVGGGGLLVIYLSLVRSMDQLTAQGVNLLFFICASLSALIVNIRKRSLKLMPVLILSLSGALSAVIGSFAASVTDISLLRKLFGALLMISGGISFFGKMK